MARQQDGMNVLFNTMGLNPLTYDPLYVKDGYLWYRGDVQRLYVSLAGVKTEIGVGPIVITDTYVVGSEAEMLALDVQVGDIAVRTDVKASFILQTSGPTVLSHWVELSGANDAPVQSVNGEIGDVDVFNTDSYLVTQVTNTLYVDNKRTDTYVENGSITRPFKTIQAAIDAVTAPSATNKYLIEIAPGAYYSDPVAINKIYVTFRSCGLNGARISGAITVTNPSSPTPEQITFVGMRISGGLTCLASHICINVVDCSVSGSDWVMNPSVPTDDEYLQVFSGIWYANAVLTNVYTYLMGGGYYSTFTASGKEFNINNADINDPFEAVLSGTLAGSAFGNRAGNSKFTLNAGVNMHMDADTEGGSVITMAGGTLTRSTKGGNILNDSTVVGVTVKDALSTLGGSSHVQNTDVYMDNVASKTLYVDKKRVDAYTEDGTFTKPFKTIQGAINKVIANGDNSQAVPYTIRVATGVYAENVVMEHANLVSLIVIGEGSRLQTQINPASGYSLQSMANNASFYDLHMENIQFTKPTMMVGAANNNYFGYNFFFVNCYWPSTALATFKNMTYPSFLGDICKFSGGVVFSNITQASINGIGGFKTSAGLTIETDEGANKPYLMTTGTAVLASHCRTPNVTWSLLNITTMTGTALQIRAVRHGISGETIPLNAQILAYHSSLIGNYVNNGTLTLYNSQVSGTLSGTAPVLYQFAKQVKNDSTVTGATVKDALETLDASKYSEDTEIKIKVYSQATEPVLSADSKMAMWIDTDDANKVYLIFRRGTGDQVSVELA